MLNLLVQLWLVPSNVECFLQSEIKPRRTLVNYAESLKVPFIITVSISHNVQINCRGCLFLIKMFMRTHCEVSGSLTYVPGITTRTNIFVYHMRSMLTRNTILPRDSCFIVYIWACIYFNFSIWYFSFYFKIWSWKMYFRNASLIWSYKHSLCSFV